MCIPESSIFFQEIFHLSLFNQKVECISGYTIHQNLNMYKTQNSHVTMKEDKGRRSTHTSLFLTQRYNKRNPE